MYLCTQFQKVKIKIITVMVISNKPLQFIIAILIACLPIVGFANNPSENTPAQTEKTGVAPEL
jgi:F-type H+-transporting ATPase subunit a